MSRDLKKRGFTFVGSTICYAFMQAVGMVNDHLVGCFRHGWRLLYQDVWLVAATRLAEVLSSVACADVVERQARDTADALLRYAKAGEPWRARDDIEVVATLDPPTAAIMCRVGLGPVVGAAVGGTAVGWL